MIAKTFSWRRLFIATAASVIKSTFLVPRVLDVV